MKVARALGWLIGGVTLLAAGIYFFRYLYYWEWHRALITGVILVAAEVALAGGLILRKVGRAPAEHRPGDDDELRLLLGPVGKAW